MARLPSRRVVAVQPSTRRGLIISMPKSLSISHDDASAHFGGGRDNRGMHCARLAGQPTGGAVVAFQRSAGGFVVIISHYVDCCLRGGRH